MIRLIHLTDVHFGGEDAAAAEGAAAFCNAHAADLIVVTGDITMNGLPREFEAAARWLSRLPEPRLATPGNHDTPYWNIPLRALTPFSRYRRYIGPPDGTAFDGRGLSVRAINSARGAQPRPDWSKGAVKLQSAQDAVESMADRPPGTLRAIACHHPLVEAVGAPVTGGVRRGRLAAQLFAAARIDLILTGHVHNPFAVALPFGDEKTYAVGGGTLSLRLRGTPPSFNWIIADQETITVEAMAWAGSRFEPYRTWALPRRADAAEREPRPLARG